MTLFNELKRRNVIRVAAAYLIIGWLLAQVSATLESALHMPEWFDTMIVTVMLIGFPITLIISWVYELTPEGIKKEIDIKASETILHETSKKLDYITIVAALAVIGMIIWQQLAPKELDTRVREKDKVEEVVSVNSQKDSLMPARAGTQLLGASIQNNTIAVLPFADLSKAGDQEYFSDGIAEEILNVLVRVDALQVTSRTSAFQFKGSKQGIPAIAKELKVRHVLEGSVRKSGETVRITAQLIDAQDDKHLWSETYDRPLTAENIFAIQDDISNAIVKALKRELGLTASESIVIKQSTQNLTAYELFLQARPLFHARKQLDKADALLSQAIELDPEYSQAWAMRGALQHLLVSFKFTNADVNEADQLGIQFANQAIALDANSALAYATKGFINLEANRELRGKIDYADILSDLKKAQNLNPHDATMLNWLARAYQSLGFLKKAQEIWKSCIEYEPRYYSCVGNYIYTSQDLGEYQNAVDAYQMGLMNGAIQPSVAPFEALNYFDKKLTFLTALGSVELFSGWHRTGEIYEAFQKPDNDHTELIKAALAFILNQNRDINFMWGDVIVPLGYEEQTDAELVTRFGQTSKFYNSPGFKARIKKSGVYQYWQQYGYPPQCQPVGSDDFECIKYADIK